MYLRIVRKRRVRQKVNREAETHLLVRPSATVTARFTTYAITLESNCRRTSKIGWNFEKFVLDRKGNVVGRFAANTSPDDPALLKLIETQLAEK